MEFVFSHAVPLPQMIKFLRNRKLKSEKSSDPLNNCINAQQISNHSLTFHAGLLHVNGDGEDRVGAAGVRVHEGLSRLALDAPLLQDLVDLLLAVHLHLLQTLQEVTVLKGQLTRLFSLLQDLIDLFLAVHLNFLQTLQVSTVLKRPLMRLFPLLQDLVPLLLAVHLHILQTLQERQC
jgi:hypothetical protein